MHRSYDGGHLKFSCLLKNFTLARYSDTDLCKIQIYAQTSDVNDAQI